MRPFFLLLLLPIVFAAKKVLLISLDGFRHDLLKETLVPHIYKFANERSSWFTNGVKSQMLTVTASNHMSIVSGLREDKHGIIGNYFWDRTKQQMYDKFNIAGGPDIRRDSELSEWNPIDPIWLLNQKNGGRSTVINWPAGDYERSEEAGVTMRRYRQPFGDHSNWPEELNLLIDSLATDNLVLWYIPEPDSVLHGNGFYGGKLEGVLTELDQLFDTLIKRMGEKGFLKETDIILTADHGHIQVLQGKTLCVNKILGKEFTLDPLYHAGDSNIYHSNSAIVHTMYEKLLNYIASNNMPYRIYLKKDVPAKWHYVNSDRTGDIVIEPLPDGQVKMNCKSDHDDSHTSTHGQDPNLQDMRALLVLSGPSFHAATKITEIPENIDLFPLMARLLNVPVPSNDGRVESLQSALRQVDKPTTESTTDSTTDSTTVSTTGSPTGSTTDSTTDSTTGSNTDSTTSSPRPDSSETMQLIIAVILTLALNLFMY